MEKKFETLTCALLKIAKTSAPYVEIENGQRLMQMYGTTATQKANAELIVTAVNAYSPMLEALKEVLDRMNEKADRQELEFEDERVYNSVLTAIHLAENKQ